METNTASLSSSNMPEHNNPFSGSYSVAGTDLFARTHNFDDNIQEQKNLELWLYNKSTLQTPSATTKGHDIYGNIFEGPNFASQDQLGLSSEPSTRDVAIKTVKDFGVHSGGAALAFGTHPYYIDFQREIGEFMNLKNIIIFSAGWMAGYGLIKGLVRPWDHVIIDKLCQNSLSEGANAATSKVHVAEHMDIKGMIEKMREIRKVDKEHAILVVTESLFAVDSESPDLVTLQKECKKYDAFLLISVANDLGSMGERGFGACEIQKLEDYSNVMISGSGSKVLCTNIGFVGCQDERVIEYLRYFSPPYMFSNVVAPPLCAAALNNLQIIRSEKGVLLRKQVMDNAIYLRKCLKEKGYKVLGVPSPFVIVPLGDELFCKIVVRLMLDNNVIANGMEYPVVPKGKARLCLQLQATHTKEHIDTLMEKLVSCSEKAKTLMANVDQFVTFRKSSAKL